MAGDNHGAETQEEPQTQEDLGQQQAAKEQPQVSGRDWEKAIAERDGRIAELAEGPGRVRQNRLPAAAGWRVQREGGA